MMMLLITAWCFVIVHTIQSPKNLDMDGINQLPEFQRLVFKVAGVLFILSYATILLSTYWMAYEIARSII